MSKKAQKGLSWPAKLTRVIGSICNRTGEDRAKVRKAVERAHIRTEGLPCWFCGLTLTPSNASFDHATPIARGGKTTEANLLFVCQGCNRAKGDFTEDEFKAILDGAFEAGREPCVDMLLTRLKRGTMVFGR